MKHENDESNPIEPTFKMDYTTPPASQGCGRRVGVEEGAVAVKEGIVRPSLVDASVVVERAVVPRSTEATAVGSQG